MKRFCSKYLTVAAAALLGLAISCGKPEGTGGGGGAVSGQNAIVVGEYASLTGKEAAFGQSSHKGTLLAVEDLNKAGGILGKQVDLKTEDTQSKPGESSTVVKKL